MTKDLWLPRGFKMVDGVALGSLRSSGDKWQIYEAQSEASVLIVQPSLANRWVDYGFIDAALLGEISFGQAAYRYISCDRSYAIAPVEEGASSINKSDALAFSVAIKETRKISREPSFHDAIYVEQYSRMLPTWTLTPRADDEMVLGTWLAGGVAVSTRSFRRLSALAYGLSIADLAEVVAAAGLSVPTELTNRAKSDAVPREDSERVESPRPLEASPDPKSFILPGRPQLENFFNEHVIDIISNPDKYKSFGIEFPSAIVLHGPPGCGKTYAVERLIEFLDWPSFSIDSGSVGSPYIHDTSKKISQVFDQALDAAPSVLVIDEMESFLSDRRYGRGSGLHHVEEVSEFLRRIPEAISRHVLIIAMTNMIQLIDAAILRRGRFDHIIEVGMPSRIEVASLLESLLCNLPKMENLDLIPLIDALTGKPLSDVAFIVREAARFAAKAGKSSLDQECLLAAIAYMPSDRDKEDKVN